MLTVVLGCAKSIDVAPYGVGSSRLTEQGFVRIRARLQTMKDLICLLFKDLFCFRTHKGVSMLGAVILRVSSESSVVFGSLETRQDRAAVIRAFSSLLFLLYNMRRDYYTAF